MQQLSLNQQHALSSGGGSSIPSSLPLQSISQGNPQPNPGACIPLLQSPLTLHRTAPAYTFNYDPDLRDFPALGSSNGSNGASTASAIAGLGGIGPTSYAAQAGTAIQVASANGNVSTGFGPDDFPALGGQQVDGHASNNPIGAGSSTHGNGVNGTSGQELAVAQQHRQSLLGAMSSQSRTTPSSDSQRVRRRCVVPFAFVNIFSIWCINFSYNSSFRY
jgi:hypothetical protein